MEYCYVSGADDGGIDTYFNYQDTIRYNTINVPGKGGIYLYGDEFVVHDNTITGTIGIKVDIGRHKDFQSSPMGQSQIYDNIVNCTSYGLYYYSNGTAINSNGDQGTVRFARNIVRGYDASDNLLAYIISTGCTSDSNAFIGSGRFLRGSPDNFETSLKMWQDSTAWDDSSPGIGDYYVRVTTTGTGTIWPPYPQAVDEGDTLRFYSITGTVLNIISDSASIDDFSGPDTVLNYDPVVANGGFETDPDGDGKHWPWGGLLWGGEMADTVYSEVLERPIPSDESFGGSHAQVWRNNGTSETNGSMISGGNVGDELWPYRRYNVSFWGRKGKDLALEEDTDTLTFNNDVGDWENYGQWDGSHSDSGSNWCTYRPYLQHFVFTGNRASNWGVYPGTMQSSDQFILTRSRSGRDRTALVDNVRVVECDETYTVQKKILPMEASTYFAASPYTFEDITRDHTVEFQFSTTEEEEEEEEADPYAITSATMDEGTVGVAYADTLVGTSPVTADYRILIRGLPPGLWLKWDGVIQGTPTTAGTYTPWVRIQARNTRAKQAWKQISITINAE
jgi:hypothetical protein